MRERKPYRIIGAYDSETTNIDENGNHFAFPILHQIGLLDGTRIEEITPENVEEHVQIEMYRHAFELYERLDSIVEATSSYVPVIVCHNLAFDMYGLSPWLSRHDVRVLAKSARKPITFTIRDDNGMPKLVIWDSLIFSQQGLERMGADCGYDKAVGAWDYDLIRTPDTPLTDDEITYAKRDVYALLAWFGWWLRRNPDIKPEKLGLNVVTKTGVVRERRHVRFSDIKGTGLRRKVGHYWLFRCRLEQAKSDDELFTMLASTRGGFTFCASSAASKPYDVSGSNMCVAAYDATSQHPAQIVSHYYPYGFKERNTQILELAFSLIGKIPLDRVLEAWDKPFPVAFYACYEFTNLRPKPGSVFERYGIYPLTSARYKTIEQLKQDEDNGDKAAYQDYMFRRDYCDSASNAKFAFGKVVSADVARFYVTELTAWEIWQAYTWDNVKAIHGYETGKFTKPNDIDVISVMQFYKAKDEYKHAREMFYSEGTIDNADLLESLGIPGAIARAMEDGTLSSGDVEATYLGLKADLNSIFGISASNQYRRDTVLDSTGISYVGDFGICNAPKNPKVWYQFGQRIVGWSRIAQCVTLQLIEPYVSQIINGDTDSIKVVCENSALQDIDNALSRLSSAIDAGKKRTCARIAKAYPELYSSLDYIGHYVCEFVTDRFCASWNKAYCTQDTGKNGKRHFAFTLAGIPTRKRESKISCFIGINGLADRLYNLGWTFEDICNVFLGYNVTFSNGVIRMNGRKFPEWGESVFTHVVDYMGKTSTVAEPAALALYPMAKTINDTSSFENNVNMGYALENNPNVNISRKLVFAAGVLDLEGNDYDFL